MTGEDVNDTSLSSNPDISLNLTPTPQSTPQRVSSSTHKTTQAAADTSSDVDKKHKDKFLKEMSKVVVKILDPYRKAGVKGHIGNTEDFKHLAKKVSIRMNIQNIFILSVFHQFNYINLR